MSGFLPNFTAVLALQVYTCLLWMCITLVIRGGASPSPSLVAPVYVPSCQLDPFPNGYYEHFGVEDATPQSLLAGRSVIARCNMGYRLIGDRRLECGSDGHIQQEAICEDIDECSFLNEDDTDAVYSLTSYDDRSESVGYPCREPATCVNTDGSFYCQCSWQKLKTFCHQFVRCDEVQSPDFGKITEQSQLHVVFACNDGYHLVGSEKRLCEQGVWNGIQPICQVTICQPLGSIIINGWSDIENRTYTHGEEIHYGCKDGYRLVGGNSWRVCAKTHWTSETPRCQAIQCEDPGEIKNGQTLLYSRDIGGEVHFRCKSGDYQLHGSRVRVCQANGRWNGTLTTCNNPETYCPTPGIPFNGKVSGSTTYDHGDVITFECNYGYDLIGSSQRRCTATGQWNGEQPVCRAKGEYDDIKEVGRHLVETTSLFRDGFRVQRRYLEAAEIDAKNRSAMAGLPQPGRLATIPREGSDGGESRGLDVYFVFDVSKSVQLGNTHMEAIEFAKAFVQKVGVSFTGIGGTRYGAIAYATKPIVVFQLVGDTVELVHQSLDTIEDLVVKQRLGQGTATSSALRMVHTNMILHTLTAPQLREERKNSDRVLFLLTDGQSNMNGSPEEEASILKDDFHVAIHCIGIGSEVNREELKRIASEPEGEHVFVLEDFKTLDELTSKITTTATDYSICGESRGPQNTDEGVMEADDVWPWQAGLYTHTGRKGTPAFFCGGTLIAPNWILSAAHCFDPKENPNFPGRDVAANLIVYMGMNVRIKKGVNIPQRAEVRNVKRIVIHSNYSRSASPTYDYDIALLELQQPFQLGPFIRTVCLPPSTNWEQLLAAGEQNKPFATGWGKERVEDLHYSENLKQVALPVRAGDDKFCRVTESETHGNLTERMFCAGYADGSADTCIGDSGGPLVRKSLPPAATSLEGVAAGDDGTVPQWRERWFQIGIISWGESCAKLNHYGYYTHLPNLVKWVNRMIQ